jgi:hypothetical protein
MDDLFTNPFSFPGERVFLLQESAGHFELTLDKRGHVGWTWAMACFSQIKLVNIMQSDMDKNIIGTSKPCSIYKNLWIYL